MSNEESRKSFTDDSATWIYWGSNDTQSTGVSDEWVWERLRAKRNALLTQSDYTVLPDIPWDNSAWIVYREKLRNLPKETTNPRQTIWPISPEGA